MDVSEVVILFTFGNNQTRPKYTAKNGTNK